MTQVYGARDLPEAQFVKGLLEAEDIPAVIQGGSLQVVLGEIPVNSGSLPSIWVNETDLDHAMQVINEFNKGGPAKANPQPSWTCQCGEILEGQFSTCWKCGTNRPADTTGPFPELTA